MPSVSRNILKEYGLLPLALSGVATLSMVVLSIYFLNQAERPILYQYGKPLACTPWVSSAINSIKITYTYPSIILILISLASVVLSYIYDRVILLFIVFSFIIFTYPFVAILDDSRVVVSFIPLNRLCEGGISGAFVAIQVPLFFVSAYVIIGNFVLLAKRWLRRRNENG